jgi:ATP phosphoribosyltransferase
VAQIGGSYGRRSGRRSSGKTGAGNAARGAVRVLTLALTKGRILRETLPLLAQAGIEPLEDISSQPQARVSHHDAVVFSSLVMRGVDVPVYVRYGAADLGVVGKDTLLEQGAEGLYEPLDLGIAPCRLMTAAPVGFEHAGSADCVSPRNSSTSRGPHFAHRGRAG